MVRFQWLAICAKVSPVERTPALRGRPQPTGFFRMAQVKKIICPSCGFKNTAPLPNNRCVSCGAKIDDLKRVLSRQEELERRYQQEGFSTLWFGVSLVVMGVLTAAIVMGLPMVVPAFDFEGSAGMIMASLWAPSQPKLVYMVSPK